MRRDEVSARASLIDDRPPGVAGLLLLALVLDGCCDDAMLVKVGGKASFDNLSPGTSKVLINWKAREECGI